jgi:transcriptional regulator with XRE-family HTH domain
VQPEPPKTLKELLRRASVVTKERGKPARLAEYLGVSRSRVSDWLNGKFEPPGDVILELSQWVQEQEEKQQKSPRSVVTASRAKTRRKVKRDEKPNIRRRNK